MSSVRLRHVFLFVVVLFCLVTLGGCATSQNGHSDSGGSSGGGGGGTPAGNGTVVLLLRDAPADNVLALRATITALSLTSSGSPVPLVASPLDQEFSGQLLRNTIVTRASVPPGTYTGLQITLGNGSVTFFNTPDGQIVIAAPTFTVSTTSVTVNATVTANGITPILLELDLPRSISFTQPSQGTQLQPSFTPTFTARVIDLATDAGLLARVDDIAGTISNISATNNTFTFTALGSGVGFTVFTDTATLFRNVASLGSLANDNIVDIDARLESSGNFRAEEVVFRGTSTGTSTLASLHGPIVEILARDATNNVTRFNLVVRETTQTITGAEVGRVVTIRVTVGTTNFRVDGLDLLVGSFTFDPQSVVVGQVVTVDLSSTQATDGFPSSTLTLKQEGYSGTVGQEIGQNTFSFVPGSDLLGIRLLQPLGLTRMTVSTSTVTQFENLTGGFGGLRASQTVAVRGLLFTQFDQPQIVAKRVRGPRT